MKKLFIRMMPAVLILLMTCPMSWSASPKSITVSWQPSITNEDGTPCTDLAGYKIYYDKDKSGVPYNGIGIQEGDSPILLPLSIYRSGKTGSYSEWSDIRHVLFSCDSV